MLEWLSNGLGYVIAKTYDGIGYVADKVGDGVKCLVKGASNTADTLSEDYTDLVDHLSGKDKRIKEAEMDEQRKIIIEMMKDENVLENREEYKKKLRQSMIDRYKK